MKVKHALEFIICFFSGHEFIDSPGYGQKLECRWCHQPYTHTLQEKWQQVRQVRMDRKF